MKSSRLVPLSVLAAAWLLSVSNLTAADNPPAHSEHMHHSVSEAEDRAAIVKLNEYVPLALKAEGFEKYAALFHADYTNWHMVGTKPLNRAEFLAGVRPWFEEGNYATDSEVVTVSIQFFGDFAYVRHFQKEKFMAPDGKRSAFVGEFASLLKKEDGKWLFYSTSFHASYRGPVEGAPALPKP